MNNFIKYTTYSLLLLMSTFMVYSCTEEITGPDVLAEKDGPAVIDYVRVTDPTVSDSLLDGAFLGSLVAIIGDNLGDTRELWFNDQKALLNPTYITDKTILVNVPTTVPSEVTNEMRLVFSDKSELKYPFKVNVPAPNISGIKSEFVPAGGIAEIHGDFFFEPLEVEFVGGVKGKNISVEKTKLLIEVPAGAQPGKIKVKTNFGTRETGFYFRDNRNIILNFDDKKCETWTAAYSDANGLMAGVQPVDGVYAYFSKDKHGAWSWQNGMTMQYWAPRGRGNVPVARGLVNDLVFKMEVNVPVEWTGVRMEIFPAPFGESEGRGSAKSGIYRWAPFTDGPYKTDGWVTVEFPLSEFVHNTDNDEPTRKIENISELANFTMMSFGPADGEHNIKIAFDNIRIVPKS